MKQKICVLMFILYINNILTSADLVEEYVEAINNFIKSTENYTYPIDSREYLKGNSESIINECEDSGNYDFIIVGAGSAGTVLANRLSDVRPWKILLLEAGGHETAISDIPAMADYIRLSDLNWGYKSVPQNNSLLSYINRTEMVTRGKALGGSSVINLMMYVRGNPEDYNKWSSEGNPGWSYKDVLPYFKKSEHSHINRPDPGYHGFNGTLNVERMNISNPLSYAFLFANKELGRNLIYDYNGQNQFGFSVLETNTINGSRDSGATAFLKPVSNRTNLKILPNTLVIKILTKSKTAVGVQFINNGKSFCAQATKEVILSAGTINTPQLMMLSGIGSAQHLQEHNIETVVNLPGVGQNLWDHIYHFLQHFTTNYTDVDMSVEDVVKRYLSGKDFTTSADSNDDVGFVNLFSSDKSRPDVELIFRTIKRPNTSYEYYKNIKAYSNEMYDYIIKPLIGATTWTSPFVLLHPKSRGTIKLKTKSPFDFPLIDPNYFSDPNQEDIKTMIAAFKYVIEISNTSSMQRYNSTMFKIDLPACSKLQYESDDYIECLIRNLASTIWHYSGTCKMGPKNDSQAVVDHNLRVYGVRNLRIVDCSVIPVTISGHTNAPAYMIGEKAGDLIKHSYKKR